jgi:hypothetical protein
MTNVVQFPPPRITAADVQQQFMRYCEQTADDFTKFDPTAADAWRGRGQTPTRRSGAHDKRGRRSVRGP